MMWYHINGNGRVFHIPPSTYSEMSQVDIKDPRINGCTLWATEPGYMIENKPDYADQRFYHMKYKPKDLYAALHLFYLHEQTQSMWCVSRETYTLLDINTGLRRDTLGEGDYKRFINTRPPWALETGYAQRVSDKIRGPLPHKEYGWHDVNDILEPQNKQVALSFEEMGLTLLGG